MEGFALKLRLLSLACLLVLPQKVEGQWQLDALDRSICGRMKDSAWHPWHVVVRDRVRFPESARYPDGCGGLLIHSNLVLTAAHCVKGQKSVKLFAGMASLPRGEPDPWLVQMASSKRICRVGPEYARGSDYANNLALIKLDKPFTYNDRVKPVCLQEFESNEPRYRSQCQTLGWPGVWMETYYRYPRSRRSARNSTQSTRDTSEKPRITHWPVSLIECDQMADEPEYEQTREDEICYQTLGNESQWGPICMIGNSGTALTCLDSAQEDKNLHYAVGLLSRGLYKACQRKGTARANYLDFFKDKDLIVALLAECAPDFKLRKK